MLPTAADAQVSVGLQFRVGPLHACVGSGESFHVKLQIGQECRTGGRPCSVLIAAKDCSSSFQASWQVYSFYLYSDGKNAAIGSAGQPKITINLPAHPFGIANPRAVGMRGNIEPYRAIRVVHAEIGRASCRERV